MPISWNNKYIPTAFGYKSKNGQVKCLFHGITSIFQQLIFSNDICVTLPLLHHHISGSHVTKFIDQVNHIAPPKTMTLIYEHCYIIWIK